jgi:serine/threonine-protein kinase
MLYPQSWQRVDGDISLTEGWVEAVRFVSPSEGVGVTFQENLVIVVDNSPASNANLDNYIQYRVSFHQIHLNGFSLLGTNSDKAIAGEPAYMLWFSYRDPNDANVELKVMEVGTKVYDTVYIISYYSTIEKYFDYLPTVEKMIDSFEVIS